MSAAPAPAELRAAAEEMARAAGVILREGYGRTHSPELKGRIDLVTEYDRRSERLLLDEIHRRFPDHAVLAEESGASDPGANPDGVRWLIDPLDGTTNFAHNYPFFCVSVAAEVGGELAAGAVYDAVRNEMFSAAAGQGTTLDGKLLRVSEIGRLESALLVTGFPYYVREQRDQILPLFEAFLMRAQGVRRDGSAALNLCYLAAGRFDGMWENGLSPWDMAAGVLMIREAGGVVTGFAGDPLRLDSRQILASNGHIHDEMKDVLAQASSARSAG